MVSGELEPAANCFYPCSESKETQGTRAEIKLIAGTHSQLTTHAIGMALPQLTGPMVHDQVKPR